jgi:K+-sensing histidine kinase KdpD
LVRESFTDAKILAQPFRVQVSLSSWQPPLFAAPAFNLTDNAVKYNKPDGTAAIPLRRVENFAELKIENTGAGIAATRV